MFKLKKKGDLSLESIIKLVLVAMCILLAVYIAVAMYRVIVSKPDEGTIRTLKDFYETASKMRKDESFPRAFYVKDQNTVVAFNSGEDRVRHFAGYCSDSDGLLSKDCYINRPQSTNPPRGCGGDNSRVCVCICNNYLQSGSDHCAEAFECKIFPENIKRVISKKTLTEKNTEDEWLDGVWGTPLENDKQRGRYFVLFGDRGLLNSAMGTINFCITKQKVDGTDDKPIFDILITDKECK